MNLRWTYEYHGLITREPGNFDDHYLHLESAIGFTLPATTVISLKGVGRTLNLADRPTFWSVDRQASCRTSSAVPWRLGSADWHLCTNDRRQEGPDGSPGTVFFKRAVMLTFLDPERSSGAGSLMLHLGRRGHVPCSLGELI